MILVGGSRIVEDQTSVGNVRKVIFPNPHSRSLSLYADSVNDSKNLPAKIINTTSNLLDKRIGVRWYPHTINHAVIIADPGSRSGWVQIQSVLPFGALRLRPCI